MIPAFAEITYVVVVGAGLSNGFPFAGLMEFCRASGVAPAIRDAPANREPHVCRRVERPAVFPGITVGLFNSERTQSAQIKYRSLFYIHLYNRPNTCNVKQRKQSLTSFHGGTMNIKVKALFAGLALIVGMAVAQAGPIIIAGTDADDHGSAPAGANLTGWLFMQQAFQNLRPAVSNTNQSVVCLGCNSGKAATAFASAFSLSTLPVAGWVSSVLTSVTDITNFFTNTGGAAHINTTGIIYMPSGTNQVGGGITDLQLAPIDLSGAAINSFVAGGGGLFTQEQGSSAVGYGWLTALLPGINFHTSGIANSSSLTITPAGNAAFPGLTDATVSAATPWHVWFDGNFGGLSTLVTGPVFNVAGGPAGPGAVVIGGGAGTVIVCGGPNAPPCPTPEPDSLPLLALGGVALLLARMRKRKA